VEKELETDPDEDLGRWEDEGGAIYGNDEKEATGESREPPAEPQSNPAPSVQPSSVA